MLKAIITLVMWALFFIGGMYVGNHLTKQQIGNGEEIQVEMSTFVCKVAKEVR